MKSERSVRRILARLERVQQRQCRCFTEPLPLGIRQFVSGAMCAVQEILGQDTRIFKFLSAYTALSPDHKAILTLVERRKREKPIT